MRNLEPYTWFLANHYGNVNALYCIYTVYYTSWKIHTCIKDPKLINYKERDPLMPTYVFSLSKPQVFCNSCNII